MANLFSVPGYGMKQCASFTELTRQRRNQWTEPALSSLPHLYRTLFFSQNQGKREEKDYILQFITSCAVPESAI